MSDGEVRYETKVVKTVRGLEAPTRAKLEGDGWEFVEQSQAGLLRSSLVFRRVKKPTPRRLLVIGGAVAAALVIVIVVGALTEGDDTATTTGTKSAQAAQISESSESLSASTSALATASAEPVTDAEVLAVFNQYFADRSAAGVVIPKAASNVTFEDGTVRVTFDPAHAGISQQTFDADNSFSNLANFVATPIAFSDDTGSRIRPSVQATETVGADGSSLGSFTHVDILALNGLSE